MDRPRPRSAGAPARDGVPGHRPPAARPVSRRHAARGPRGVHGAGVGAHGGRLARALSGFGALARRVGRARGSPHDAERRSLRRCGRRRRTGRPHGRGLRGIGGAPHARVRTARPRRPGRHELPDRELSRLPRWRGRRGARCRHVPPGASSRRRVSDRRRDRVRSSRIGQDHRPHAHQRRHVAGPQRGDRHRGRLPPAERSGSRAVCGPRDSLRLGHRRGAEIWRPRRRRGRRCELSGPGRPSRRGVREARDDAGARRIACRVDVAVPSRPDRSPRADHRPDELTGESSRGRRLAGERRGGGTGQERHRSTRAGCSCSSAASR